MDSDDRGRSVVRYVDRFSSASTAKHKDLSRAQVLDTLVQ